MSDNRIGRRSFLAAGGIVAGALVVAGGRPEASPFTPRGETGRSRVEIAKPGRRLLVAYASAAGSTAETATFIGERLSRRGWTVDVRDVRQAPAPKGYSAVIVASAVRAGAWLSEATAYVKAQRLDLGDCRPVYLTMCMTLHEDTPPNRAAVAAYIKPVREIVEPRAAVFFAGKMDYSKLSFFTRQIVKLKKVPQGDFRNWALIGDWADGLDRELAASAAS